MKKTAKHRSLTDLFVPEETWEYTLDIYNERGLNHVVKGIFWYFAAVCFTGGLCWLFH